MSTQNQESNRPQSQRHTGARILEETEETSEIGNNGVKMSGEMLVKNSLAATNVVKFCFAAVGQTAQQALTVWENWVKSEPSRFSFFFAQTETGKLPFARLTIFLSCLEREFAEEFWEFRMNHKILKQVKSVGDELESLRRTSRTMKAILNVQRDRLIREAFIPLLNIWEHEVEVNSDEMENRTNPSIRCHLEGENDGIIRPTSSNGIFQGIVRGLAGLILCGNGRAAGQTGEVAMRPKSKMAKMPNPNLIGWINNGRAGTGEESKNAALGTDPNPIDTDNSSQDVGENDLDQVVVLIRTPKKRSSALPSAPAWPVFDLAKLRFNALDDGCKAGSPKELRSQRQSYLNMEPILSIQDGVCVLDEFCASLNSMIVNTHRQARRFALRAWEMGIPGKSEPGCPGIFNGTDSQEAIDSLIESCQSFISDRNLRKEVDNERKKCTTTSIRETAVNIIQSMELIDQVLDLLNGETRRYRRIMTYYSKSTVAEGCKDVVLDSAVTTVKANKSQTPVPKGRSFDELMEAVRNL